MLRLRWLTDDFFRLSLPPQGAAALNADAEADLDRLARGIAKWMSKAATGRDRS